jgi:hypothetical protein
MITIYGEKATLFLKNNFMLHIYIHRCTFCAEEKLATLTGKTLLYYLLGQFNLKIGFNCQISCF